MSDEMVQEKTETAALTSLEEIPVMDTPMELSAVVEASAPEDLPAANAEAAEPGVETPEAAAEPTPVPEVVVDTPSMPIELSTDQDEAPISDNQNENLREVEMGMDFDQSLQPLRKGDIVDGVVVQVTSTEVLVDVGAKSEGIIYPNELTRNSNTDIESVVKVGDKIRVYVIDSGNANGNPILSKKRADFEQNWEKLQHSMEIGETVHAQVSERVKGGLHVDLGVRGFVPASHVGNGNLKVNLDRYVGQTIALKVIEVDREKKKLILSNKLAMEEERKKRSEETRLSLTEGQLRRGAVRRLTSYGAFVDLGGIDGLLHISEISWKRINDPKEVLREGQEIEVKIVRIDLEQNKVSLSLRQTLPDPWIEVPNLFREGDIVTGIITRVLPFGAFVQLEGDVEGIIPNVEMPRNRGARGPIVQPGDSVNVKVLSVRPEEKKISLSLRATTAVEEHPASPANPPLLSRDNKSEAPQTGNSSPSSLPRKGRASRSRGDGEFEDFSRYTSGRQEEPRFTIGDAFAAAQKKDRPKRERRIQEEEESDYLDNSELEKEIETES